MKKWYYLSQKSCDEKVGVCMDGGRLVYVTRYDSELGRRVYGELAVWDEEERLYLPWEWTLKRCPTLEEIRTGLKSGHFIAG